MNTKNLIRGAGLSTVVAGVSFVVLGLLHPPNILSSVTTTQWIIVHSLAMAMSVFGLLGITGIYAQQAEAAGWLGLAGYLLLGFWLMLILPFTFIEVIVLPLLATEAPAFAESFLRIYTASADHLNFGTLATIWTISDGLLLISGLVFGIATLRAGVLSRWAAGAFTVGIGLAPVFGMVPPVFRPLAAVPIGLGLAWLGYSLWSERRAPAVQPAPGRRTPQLRHTGAE